jgi:predicted P-loop ATPase
MKPEYPRLVTDTDITGIQEWLQLAGLATVSRDTVYQAVEMLAREHTFHPVKDYLESLTWNGTERLEDWLTDCFGVTKTKYTMAVGCMFFVGLVARIYQPGCQADYMLILEGPQGIRKSTACRVIAGEWFSDSMPENVASKDAALHLRGKWLVEIAELHHFSRAETAALKAFITRREDIYRPPYGRKEVYRPRQNLFVGTTNKKIYLKDPTGARRFWPVVTTDIDIELLTSQRDQLFAEALVRYRRGEHWWPNADFEAKCITPEQETRFEADAWEQPIAEYLSKKPNSDGRDPDGRTTVFEVARKALFFDAARIGTADQHRITDVLQRLGWCRGKRQAGTGTRWWVPQSKEQTA